MMEKTGERKCERGREAWLRLRATANKALFFIREGALADHSGNLPYVCTPGDKMPGEARYKCLPFCLAFDASMSTILQGDCVVSE